MNTYGPPSFQTRNSRPSGTVAVQRARRAIAAAKNSAGWVRKSYLQSAIEHLADAEWAALDHDFPSTIITGIVQTTLEFYSVASEDELATAVAQVIRALGVELDASQALTCELCGSPTPTDRSCGCFDNGCQ